MVTYTLVDVFPQVEEWITNTLDDGDLCLLGEVLIETIQMGFFIEEAILLECWRV